MIKEKEVNKPKQKQHQKLKPYIILLYLMRYTDENHFVRTTEIEEYLKEDCGIYAQRRSIYSDIEEINTVAVMLDEMCSIDEAEEILAEYESRKFIVYDEHEKGYRVNRQYNTDDIRLLAECVYSARFIPESRSGLLIDSISNLVSCYEE